VHEAILWGSPDILLVILLGRPSSLAFVSGWSCIRNLNRPCRSACLSCRIRRNCSCKDLARPWLAGAWGSPPGRRL